MDEENVKKDVVPSHYRDKYKETGGTCGDFIAEALSKVAKDGVEALATVKAENGIPAEKWATMNSGMQRMNLANTLRAAYLRGETVKILGREYNAVHQSEDFNGEIQNDDSVLARLAEFLDLQQNDRTITSLSKLFYPPENKSAIAKVKREEAKAVKESAKALSNATKVFDRASVALTKAKEANEKNVMAFDAVKVSVSEAESAYEAAGDEGAGDEAAATKAKKAVDAAKAKEAKAKEKADASAAKVDEAQKAVDAAKEAVDALTPAEQEEA